MGGGHPGPPASSGTDSGACREDSDTDDGTHDAGQNRSREFSREHGLRRHVLARRALPPIRTFTVGPGIPPGQPPTGCGRVADCYRRFGITPTPECAA
ncbi:hypothetical protein SFR_6285 [Streptomyces sp. FR-008]|nr:hypothetical protein SFR_6285 [Streptomyces sp. FR-008]